MSERSVSPGARASSGSAATLRLLSYNVHDLLDDRDAVAHVIRSASADVACLQEVPRRRASAHRVARLARETGLRWVAGGRTSGGTAVLTGRRVDLLGAQAARLPVTGPLTRTRGYALATVAAPGGPQLTAVSVHLPLRPHERVDHARRVLARLRGLAPPYVVAGDLNELPGGPSWAVFGELLRDYEPAAPTYPAGSPHARIDAVLVSAGLSVSSVRVVGEQDGVSAADLVAASDHLPLVADLAAAPTLW